jgi:hypothetical protein
MSEPAKTEEVFGIRAKLVRSYVERTNVDQRFVEALRSDHHVVVYGSSKQGKTSLRQKHLRESECVIVRCSPRMTILTLYQSVLRQCGARIQTIETQTFAAGGAAKVSAGFRAIIPWVGGIDGGAEASASASRQQALSTEYVSYNLDDAQSIAELLLQLGNKKWIVLENYHYLPVDTQKAVAFDLKTFHEVGIRFLILGIWREANLLVTHNGDLQGRIVEIPVEPWELGDFDRVADAGSKLLNIQIRPSVLERFKKEAYGNVGLLQEFLKQFCLDCSILETQTSLEVLDSDESVTRTIGAKLESQRNALLRSLQGIAAKSRVRRNDTEKPLLLPYYLVMVILDYDVERLQDGIDKSQLLGLLRQRHYRADKEAIRAGDVTNLVLKLPTYQADMNPPILYYDGNSRRIRVVDSTVFFVLANADKTELADEIPFPESEASSDDADSAAK